jgi:hypothetical protein
MTEDNNTNTPIFYCIEDIELEKKDNINIAELMNQLDNVELHNEQFVPYIMDYHENYTIKELLLICEYYGFAKDIKTKKFNKQQIIEYLVSFENDFRYSTIVHKRKTMWFYINELKNDKFMKKYILW